VIESYDVGSLPLVGDAEKFLEGATCFRSYPTDDSVRYFERRVIEGFLDKIGTGMDVPNYTQFRDMNEMFLEMIKGVERVKGGFMETGILSIKEGEDAIPEVVAIKKGSQEIWERTGKSFKMKICVTGPYTLSSLFLYKDNEIFSRLGNVISKIMESSIFEEKHGSVSLVAVDEPVFGLLDDPLMDHGSEGRENLLRAWESIFRKATSKGVQTCMHLHSTADELFWEVKTLNIIESHIDNPLYYAERTKKLLESTDKFLKASIGVVDFNSLIKENLLTDLPKKVSEIIVNERIAEAWKRITSGKLNPNFFLEDIELMGERLTKILNRFGAERVPYAGPECGLQGFPTYECALECLKRVSSAVRGFTNNT